jgi:hypothetical protein
MAFTADGTLVGASAWDSYTLHTCYWAPPGTAIVDVGPYEGDNTIPVPATAVSADGSVIVGVILTTGAIFRWTAAGGFVAIDVPGSHGAYFPAVQISGNGTVIAADYETLPGADNNNLSARWTEAGGWVDLGLLTGYPYTSVTLGRLSSDGSIVGGQAFTFNQATSEACYWGADNVPVGLGAGTGFGGMTADGSVIVGSTATNNAFRWTAAGGVVAIGTSVGAVNAGPISPDGRAIVLQDDSGTWWVLDTTTDVISPMPTTTSVWNQVWDITVTASGQILLAVQTVDGGSWYANVYAVPPSGITLADLFFSNSPGFVDLAVASNRRAFISAGGGAQNLGVDGSAPYGVTPPVFLTSNGTPSSFAANSGRGGAFTVSGGGALAAGTSDPPSSSQTVTTSQQNTPRAGVLGDYASGNLYAFNVNTLTDNGQQRRWLRRWRALAKSSEQAKRFAALQIAMQTGINVPEGTVPHMTLRWSDDGGATWSDERIQPAGVNGATTQTIKYNRLGSTRRYSQSDRIFELSSADPFPVVILWAEVDVS